MNDKNPPIYPAVTEEMVAMPVTPSRKKTRRSGARSSEFKYGLAPLLLGAVATAIQQMLAGDDPILKAVVISTCVLAAGIAVAGYSIGRGLAKQRRRDAR